MAKELIPLTAHPIYGSMLSEVLKLLFAGKSSEILQFLLDYIRTHYWEKLFPPAPTPIPMTSVGAADAEVAFAARITEAVQQGPKLGGPPAGLKLPDIIDYIINLLKGVVAVYLPDLELQIVNYALTVVVPAMRAQGLPWSIVANFVETLLLKIKESLDAHLANG